MPRILAAIVVLIIFIGLTIFVFRAISRSLQGSGETVGKVLAAAIIAAAAYTLFGQGFLLGYLE